MCKCCYYVEHVDLGITLLHLAFCHFQQPAVYPPVVHQTTYTTAAPITVASNAQVVATTPTGVVVAQGGGNCPSCRVRYE